LREVKRGSRRVNGGEKRLEERLREVKRGSRRVNGGENS
jgi:hypothetical protein